MSEAVRFSDRNLSTAEPFYLSVSDGDLTWSAPEGFATEQEAIEPLMVYAEEHGGGGLVFKCIPVVQVKAPPRRKGRIVRLDSTPQGHRP